MNDKTRRQGAILRLVRERRISTQEELVSALGAAGHEVVQTTVSRDVHELGLTKVRMPDGSLVYAPADAAGLGPPARPRPRSAALGAHGRVERQSRRGHDAAVATPPRSPTRWTTPATRDILGTLAGENTVMVVAREGVSGAELRDELQEYLMEGAA